MTPGARQIHWTQFPTTAITGRDGQPVDWIDHAAAHRAVSRLFTPGLPGQPGERRSNGGILYRVDVLGDGQESVLVQSQVVPELVPATARTMAVSAKAWTFAPGTKVAFRLAVNPIKRTTRYYDAGRTEVRVRDRDHGSVKRTARVVPPEEMEAWLTAKLSTALHGLEVLNHRRDETRSGSHKIIVDIVDGVAVVNDEGELDRLRREGVGRSKAYGCGLMTVTPLS